MRLRIIDTLFGYVKPSCRENCRKAAVSGGGPLIALEFEPFQKI